MPSQLASLLVHFSELELGNLEPGHRPPAGEGLDVIAQRLHVRVVLSPTKRKEKNNFFQGKLSLKTEHEMGAAAVLTLLLYY